MTNKVFDVKKDMMINAVEFAKFVDMKNSGYDRDSVFVFLKEFLKMKKKEQILIN